MRLRNIFWKKDRGQAMEMDNNHLGRIIRQHRVSTPLTLSQLAARAGVSASHLGRVERGQRYPSARVLSRITEPLGFGEGELFALAGYLSRQDETVVNGSQTRLDPFVAGMLRQEPYEVQRAVIVILTILKSIARQIGGCPLGLVCYPSCFWWQDGGCSYRSQKQEPLR
jgi:transcriptional regulator with XRE-family HTH domain